MKDGKQVTEYKENDLDDLCLQTVLRQIYKTFKVPPNLILILI
jgi:hypothetical protein